MNRNPYWMKNTYLTLGEALNHADTTLAKQVGDCCKVEDDGFGCTLFKGHSGDHEAWSGNTCYHKWPNRHTTPSH